MSVPEEIKEGIDKRKKAAFDLYLWQYGGSTSFTSMLFTLVAKADLQNRAKLFTAFPLEVSIWLEWQSTPREQDFFDKYEVVEDDRD